MFAASRVLRRLGRVLAPLALLVGAGQAAAQLTITPITWDVIGLDSNNPLTSGPDTFPVGARVCNVGSTTLTGVKANFFWDSTHPYINSLGLTEVKLDDLPSGTAPGHFNTLSNVPPNCRDAYFNVIVSRVDNSVTDTAYNATRQYHIEATATGAAMVRTPINRQLYVEKLVSQNRNSVVSFTALSPTISVGQVMQFRLLAKTATGGYEQLENFPVLPNSVYQILNVTTSYLQPTGARNSSTYADACGWDNLITSPTYRSCIGPTRYAGGKAGDDIESIYTVRVISGNTNTVNNLIYDFSGSSYHYNSDYGTSGRVFTALAPDLTMTKTSTGNFTVGQTNASFTFTVSAAVTDVYGTTTITDTLPTGLSLPDGPVTLTGTNSSSWACTSASNTVTCRSTNVDTPGQTNTPFLKSGTSSTFNITGIVVGASAPSSVTNTATVSNPNENPNLRNNNTGSVTVQVNAPPVANNVTNAALLSTAPATTLSTGLSATDSDGTIASYTVVSLPSAASGVLALNGAPVTAGQTLTPAQAAQLTFDPAPGFSGNATFTYRATDNLGLVSNTATYTLPVNAPPVAVNDTATTDVNTAVTFSVTGNDTDTAPGTVNVATVDLDPSAAGIQTSFTVSGRGTFTVNTSGAVTFTPVSGYSGTASTPYTVQDNQGALSNAATITVTVRPRATNDTATTLSNQAANINVLGNDVGTGLTNVVFPTQAAGTVSNGGKTLTVTGQGRYDVQADGTVTFTPATNFIGTATAVTYQATDSSGQTAAATLTVTVTNRPPTANTVTAPGMPTTNAATSIPPLSATDSDGTIASYTVVSLPSAASGVLAVNGVAVTTGQTLTPAQAAQLTFDPALGFSGNATFTYRATDNLGAVSNTATYTLPVTPVAVNDTASTLSNQNVNVNVLTNDRGTGLTVSSVQFPSAGQPTGSTVSNGGKTLTVTGQGRYDVQADGTVTFTPALNFIGTASPVTYQVTDGSGQTATATLTITVTNRAPTATADSVTTPQDTNVTVQVTANDTDPEGNLDLSSVDLDPSVSGVQTTFTVAGKGTFTADASGNVTLDPVAGFSGTVSVTYTVRDVPGALSNPAAFTVTVQPRAVDDTATVNGNLLSYATKNSVTTAVLGNDVGTGLDATSVVFSSNSSKTLTNSQGTYMISNTGAITFTPADGFSGTTTPVTYRVTDASGQTTTANLTVTVNAPPTAVNDSVSTSFNQPITFSVTANDTDVAPGVVDVTTVDLDPATSGVQTTRAVTGEGTFTVTSTGNVTFTPVTGFTGTSSILYTVNDNQGALSNPATIAVLVTTGAPDLTVSKTAPTYASPTTATLPSSIVYTLTVTNSGTVATNGQVEVTDNLPSGLTVVSISGNGWTCSTLTCTRTDALAAGASYPAITLTVSAPTTAQLDSTASLRNITNSAVVSGGGESNTSNNVGTATTKMVYTKVTKQVRNVDADGRASVNGTTVVNFGTNVSGAPGEVLEYCIAFTNNGGADLAKYVLSDGVPINTTYIPGSAEVRPAASFPGVTPSFDGTQTTWNAKPVRGVVTANLGTVAVGAQGQLCFQATIR